MAPGRNAPPKGKALIALAGGFGGISPNLLRLAIDLVGGKELNYLIPTFAFGLVLLAAMGAGIALVWGEMDHKRAFYVGLGLPSLIQVGAATAAHKDPGKDLTVPDKAAAVRLAPPEIISTFSLFSSPAYAEPLQDKAQPVPQVALPKDHPQARQPGRKLTLVLEDVPNGARLIFASPDGKILSDVTLGKSSPLDAGSRIDLKVPDFAASAFFRIDNSQSDLLLLNSQAGSTSAYRVDVDRRGWGGFLKALGVQDPSLLKFDIEKLEPAKP